MWFRSLLRGTCSAEYSFAFFLVVTGYCWIVFLAYPISLGFPCAGFRPRLISHPRSRHHRRRLLRLRFHTWRLSSDLPGLRDSPPNLLLRLAWLGVLSLAPFTRLGDLCLTSGPGQHDLVRSFWIEAPVRPFRPPAWDLSAVLQFLNSTSFSAFHRVSSSFGEEGPVFHGLGHC